MITKANLKALGFTGIDQRFGTLDGDLEFNVDYPFDYDLSDGVDPSKVDFLSIVIHEIGHLLGFVSGVDNVEQGFSEFIPSLLDLYRFQSLYPNFETDARMANPRKKDHFFYYPELAGETETRRFSTGVSTGDGHQASHWASDEIYGKYVGVMEPSVTKGRALVFMKSDFYAFKAIGYQPCKHTIPIIMNIREIHPENVTLIVQFILTNDVTCKTKSLTTKGTIIPKTGYIHCTKNIYDESIAVSTDSVLFSDFHAL